MQFWGLTDTGCVRKQNQDAYRIERLDRNNLLCVVCDGMGGAKSGDVASAMAAETLVQEVRRNWSANMDLDAVEQMLCNATKAANFAVYEKAQSQEEFSGMGTTLVAALVQGRSVVISNVGDSRAYHVGEHGIRRITEDHSLVEMMLKLGELTPEQARNYPGKNLITRAIGTEGIIQSDLTHLTLEKGDSLLLCSDGLSNTMDEQEILFEVVHGVNKQYCCQRLVDIAKNRGAPDNVTSVFILV